VVELYAAWAAGAVAVPINTRLAAPEVRFILEDIAAPVESEAQDCVILYTSGTTGRPKGAVNTHANVLAQNVEQHAAAWGIGENDRFLVTTPLAHRAGMARLVNALGLGGTLVIMERFDAQAALELVERGEEVWGWLEYSSELFDRARIERMAEHYGRLVASVARVKPRKARTASLRPGSSGPSVPLG